MPANHHYMIYWLSAGNALSHNQLQDIFKANLELYNLITIFLTSKEIHEFLNVLNKNERDAENFFDAQDPDRRSRFHYYIVGPVASGKSTLLEQLRCFNTFEEWTRRPPRLMYRASDKLDEEQRREVDAFVYEELKEKNNRMVGAKVGIHFMDRAPLDLYAFPNNVKEQKRKTGELRKEVTRHKSLQDGEIVFLTASGEELEMRNLQRGRTAERSGDAQYFNDQTKALKKIYNPALVLPTDSKTPGEIARRVARHVLLDCYCPVSFDEIMKEYE